MSFTDLPPEMRNLVYEHYIADVDETALLFSCGEFWPPSLARTSSQVREEFMSYWRSKHHNLDKTRYAKVQFIYLDFSFLTRFLENAAEVSGHDYIFKGFHISLLFTKSWTPAASQSGLKAWVDWLNDGPNYAISQSGVTFEAQFRLGAHRCRRRYSSQDSSWPVRCAWVRSNQAGEGSGIPSVTESDSSGHDEIVRVSDEKGEDGSGIQLQSFVHCQRLS